MTVLEALIGEIDGTEAPCEWCLGLACTKRIDDVGEFDLFLPQPVADPTATERRFPFERVDVMPAAAIEDVATMLRAAE